MKPRFKPHEQRRIQAHLALEEIRADIEALEQETEGLLDQILVEVGDD